ncbi:MAG TPA: GlsB/YeaQ/YmgE family stress response membrane protein [Candidatus Saccharimonadales bacterium]|nr:GlsB/YeaQ/YmgE family stress response membrane protein [Candidatus Saccharimonadales bacterium]
MTDFIFWTLFGILAGWIASIITETQGWQKVLSTMVIGVLGAIAGGTLMRMMNERGIAGFSIPSLLTAVCGAIILLTLVQMTDRGK